MIRPAGQKTTSRNNELPWSPSLSRRFRCRTSRTKRTTSTMARLLHRWVLTTPAQVCQTFEFSFGAVCCGGVKVVVLDTEDAPQVETRCCCRLGCYPRPMPLWGVPGDTPGFEACCTACPGCQWVDGVRVGVMLCAWREKGALFAASSLDSSPGACAAPELAITPTIGLNPI